MENSLTKGKIPILVNMEENYKNKSVMGISKFETLPDFTQNPSRKRRIDQKDDEVFVLEEEEEEEEEVEKKIMALQRIVPGGESLGVDKLFDETFEYILALKCQIKAMRAVENFIQGLEKEKRKVGG